VVQRFHLGIHGKTVTYGLARRMLPFATVVGCVAWYSAGAVGFGAALSTSG
jgi:hypothetical protein